MKDLLALGVPAFLLGAAHALEPGHGKTFLVGALANTKRTWTAPVLLASSTAFGHMFGVVLFSALAFFVAHDVMESDARRSLEVAVGVFALSIGVTQLRRAFHVTGEHEKSCSCCRGKQHDARSIGELRQLGLVGLLIGLIPCPSALALAVSAAGFNSLSQTLTVAFIFGIGVASTLLIVGLLVTLSSKRLREFSGSSILSRYGGMIGPISTILVGILVLLHSFEHPHP